MRGVLMFTVILGFVICPEHCVTVASLLDMCLYSVLLGIGREFLYPWWLWHDSVPVALAT